MFNPPAVHIQDHFIRLSVGLSQNDLHFLVFGGGDIFTHKIRADGQLTMPRSTSTANWMIAGLPKSTNAFNAARMVRPVKNTSSTKTIFMSMSELETRMAIGQKTQSDSSSEGNRTVTYDQAGKKWTVTFVNNKATAIKTP